MPPSRPDPATVGSNSFDPDNFFETWSAESCPQEDDLRDTIIRAFGLKATDDYVYRAIASVTLSQVQEAIAAGRRHGLHAWYVDGHGREVFPPSALSLLVPPLNL